MLEVVEHQKRALVPQVIQQRLDRTAAPGNRDRQRLRDCRRHQLRILNGSKWHEIDTVGEAVHDVRRDLQAQPRLAGSTWAGEGQQTRSGEQLRCLAHLVVAADEAGQLGREVVRGSLQSLQRRKVGG